MTKSDELIELMVKDLSPLPPHAFRNRIISVTALGVAGATLGLILTYYFRSGQTVTASAFLVKFAYTAGIMLTLVVALANVARPGGKVEKQILILAVIFSIMLLLAAAQLGSTPTTAYNEMIFGYSSLICPFLIVAFAGPAFFWNFWFLRRSAPTRPKLAGLIAGAGAGAIGAWVYSWACIENGFAFIAIWYSLGIALSGLLGALCGPAWLRW